MAKITILVTRACEFAMDGLRRAFRPGSGRPSRVVVLGAPILLALVAGVVALAVFSSSLPSLEQLENIEPRLVTRLYDKNGDLAREFFVEKRIWTSIDSIPEIVPKAVMASEDRDFYDHIMERSRQCGKSRWRQAAAKAASGKKRSNRNYDK